MAVQNDGGLWLPTSSAQATANFKKSPAPPLGDKFGAWAGRDLVYRTLPGGAVMQFDLNKLTLAEFRAMRDHYQINANLTLLTFMVHQISWKISCENQKIATEIEEQIRPRWAQIIRGISQAFWAGYSPMAVNYDNDVSGRRVTLGKVKDLVPEECRVEWEKVDGWAPPGKTPPKINKFAGIRPQGQSFPVPVENSLWYPLLMENGNYYGRKLLRPAFIPWFFSNLIHLFANRYFERFGEPLPIGRANFDQDVSVDGESVSGKEAMEAILRNLRSRSVVVMPSDRDPETQNYEFDIEYLESQMRGADWERYLTRLDEEMSLGLFTPILMLRTADVGSYNLGVNHMQVWMWMLNALAADIKDYLDAYLVNRLKDFNYGPKAPRATWEFLPMGKQNTETVRAIVTEMMRAGKLAPADIEELGEYVGMELKEIRQITKPAEEPEVDERVGRPDRDNPSNSPGRDGRSPTVEAASAVRAEIVERVRAQAFAAHRDGRAFTPTLGFRRKFEDALAGTGLLTDHEAATAANDFYTRMNWFCEDLVSVTSEPEPFVEAFDKASRAALERALNIG